ncbi:MAG TPA: twin-arginine translocase TatA/TatE family subunit [Sphingomicrobium sp.]|nr:twin-arginine translocase TatA/TatE family subunit [Sphingomicrobium sp.]
MGSFSLIHWIILGVVILLLFGGNRFSAMMSDVAKGLKSFKKGLAEDEEEKARDPRSLPPQSRSPEQPIDVTPEPSRTAEPRPPQSDDRTGG